MKIKLRNKELGAAIHFLTEMNLVANKDSRHRSKLIKLLTPALEELITEEQKLIESCGIADDQGKLLPPEKRDPEKTIAFSKDQQILLNEEVVIDGGMFEKNLKELFRILNEYEGELSGEDAEIYDRLLDEFEKDSKEDTE